MKKAKTRKNIFTFFSAILGVVFAFITGVTYCATSLNLVFGTKENSTSAYMGNQQFEVVNDTKNNPIQFNNGAHNFEIALQYAFDYKFDLRVSYSLTWSKKNGESTAPTTDNVILHFANRDNIIYDENYIFFADSFNAGNGKISIIAGVDFVDPTDENYFGRTLTINILNSDVKIRKYQSSYAKVPSLINDVVEATNNEITSYDSVAAQTWHQYKINKTATTTTNAYVMLHNYRRDFNHGMQYPGNVTAYKKPTSTTDSVVSAPVWTGGNRGYAGIGMYVIAGSSNLELEVQVSGIWRTPEQPDLNTENNIQFNYAEGWEFTKYSLDAQGQNRGLWDIRTFTYYIEANTGKYINILDSVEITSAGINTTKDYRLVANSVVVNSTTLTYEENSSYAKFSQITSKVSAKAEQFKYSQKSVSVVNTTTYLNGLYNSSINAALQSYNNNISLINNTNETRQVTVGLGLNYHISNGKENLYDTEDPNKTRAIDLIDRPTTPQYTFQDAFSGDNEANGAVNSIYYSYTGSASDYLSNVNDNVKQTSYTITLAPYSSANLLTSYSVSADLAEVIMRLFDETNIDNDKLNAEHDPAADDSRFDYFDVWTYLTVNQSSNIVATSPNLVLQTRQTASNTVVSVKNNTNKTVTGISVNDFALKVYSETGRETIITSKPNDWLASFWKYYKIGSNVPLAQAETFDTENGYYTIKKSFSMFVINTNQNQENYTLLNSFAFGTNQSETDTTKLVNSSKKLLPGESVDIISLNSTDRCYVSGSVSTTTASNESDLTIIKNGTTDAFIINYSTNSYYLKLSGKHTGTNFKTYAGENFTYYIGIVRPGQILKLSMSEVATISKITINYTQNGNYGEFSVSNLTGWSANAQNSMANYFNINK
ncbi:MAG: hypothetical protein IKY10_00755 [Clostridia bacterium]|nr:hypothetical protein [Clostridia bacterium]